MSSEDWSRFAAVAREYAEADDAVNSQRAGALENYPERYQRLRMAAKRYRRELHKMGYDAPPGGCRAAREKLHA